MNCLFIIFFCFSVDWILFFFWASFYVLDVSHLSDKYNANVFSYSLALHFQRINAHLKSRIFSLDKVWLTILSLILALGALSRKSLPTLKNANVISTVQFSHSVVSDSLQPHESQHARPPCPSPTPGVYSNPCPSSRRCHPAISSSVVPFSSCPQSLPTSGSFPISQLFAWGGQSIGVSASASVPPKNTQDWFPLGWTGWISLQSKGLSRVFSNTTVQKHQFFST